MSDDRPKCESLRSRAFCLSFASLVILVFGSPVAVESSQSPKIDEHQLREHLLRNIGAFADSAVAFVVPFLLPLSGISTQIQAYLIQIGSLLNNSNYLCKSQCGLCPPSCKAIQFSPPFVTPPGEPVERQSGPPRRALFPGCRVLVP